jgi:citrate/tricarballylate utilization protein
MADTAFAGGAATSGSTAVHASQVLTEADRLMTICNSCRYCEGVCVVFPAMEMRRAFPDGDLNYLANLCHNCGACYYDCQFSPPHEFDVNVPKVLAKVRNDSYSYYVWPAAFAGLFERNGLFVALAAAFGVSTFIIGFVAAHDFAALFRVHTGPGAFYRLMPHNAMAGLFGGVTLYAVVALAMGIRAFWRDIGAQFGLVTDPRSLWQAMKDVAQLRYLDGGGVGCMDDSVRPSKARRLYHHLTFYGFVLCFLSTSTATIYHYLLKLEAPYFWYDLPVVLGTAGGLGLIAGPAGFLAAKWRAGSKLADEARLGMDTAFIVMLLLTSLTGLLLLVFRSTAAMGILLAVHLGVVFALFLSMPYGKFVHGIYRSVALIRFAHEKGALPKS